MPVPLSTSAATMPAMAVPCPFGSVPPSPAPTIEVPATTFPFRSGCEASTPVSRIATVADPPTGEPYTWSQPIFGSDHCWPYCGSSGAAATSRAWSASTRVTIELAPSVATAESTASAGIVTEYMCSGAIDASTVAPTDASSDSSAAVVALAAKVTM